MINDETQAAVELPPQRLLLIDPTEVVPDLDLAATLLNETLSAATTSQLDRPAEQSETLSESSNNEVETVKIEVSPGPEEGPEVNAYLVSLLSPDKSRLFKLVRIPPEQCPPVLEDMMADIERVIASIAHQYTDQSCPHLHFDELVGQGREKLARLITRGDVERMPTRKDFFKFFKTAVNNHVKGLVHRYRFTMKRTGIRPPQRVCTKKHEHTAECCLTTSFESSKPVEFSLDDPESGIQVSDEAFQSGDVYDTPLYEEIARRLTPFELLVMRQMIEPNMHAHYLAQIEGHRGKKLSSVKVAVRAPQLAEGLGVSLEVYEQAVESIRMKAEAIKSENELPDFRYNTALATLEQTFNLQIPASVDKIMVRRLLTLCARANHHKVTPEIAEMLAVVGAKAPEIQGNMISCYGVLYQRNHRICSTCGLANACRSEAANVGLGDITIHPKLLGTKLTRMPALITRGQQVEMEQSSEESGATETVIEDNAHQPQETIVAHSQRDEEILAHLKEHYRPTKYINQLYFKHKDSLPSKKVKFIFWVGPGDGPLNLRFCRPSAELKRKLQTQKNGCYLPDECPASDAIILIDQHSKETFE